MLSLGRDSPCREDDDADHSAEDGRVALPVVRLAIPAARRRPNVLGVRDFAAAAHRLFRFASARKLEREGLRSSRGREGGVGRFEGR